MIYIISNIVKSLYSDDDDYGFYKIVETIHTKGYIIVENRNDGKQYKISVKELKG